MPNALTAPPNQAQPQQAPAPNHVQTVALLRHFDMINKQLKALLANPDLGKADIRTSVIDGVTKLVGDRIISPTQAVQQMTSFPDKPFDQKTWLVQMLQHNMQAANAVLAHHGQAFAGQPEQPTPSADNHIQDVAGAMQSHYPGNKNA